MFIEILAVNPAPLRHPISEGFIKEKCKFCGRILIVCQHCIKKYPESYFACNEEICIKYFNTYSNPKLVHTTCDCMEDTVKIIV